MVTLDITEIIKWWEISIFYLDHLILHLEPPGSSQYGGLPSLLSGSATANVFDLLVDHYEILHISRLELGSLQYVIELLSIIPDSSQANKITCFVTCLNVLIVAKDYHGSGKRTYYISFTKNYHQHPLS